MPKAMLFLCILWILLPGLAGAQETLTLRDYEAIQFADALFNEGRFEEARIEYLRYRYYFPKGKFAEHAELQILRSFYLSKRFEEVLFRIAKNKIDNPSVEYRYRSGFLKILAWMDKNEKRPFRLRLPYIKEGLGLVEELPEYPGKSSLIEFKQKWHPENISEQKSPILAGTLSAIVPGAGSGYVGRYREGVYSFFITAMFYWAGYEAYREDLELLSYLLTGFGITFHAGSIYTAVNSAHKINDNFREEKFRELRQEYGIFLKYSF